MRRAGGGGGGGGEGGWALNKNHQGWMIKDNKKRLKNLGNEENLLRRDIRRKSHDFLFDLLILALKRLTEVKTVAKYLEISDRVSNSA